MKEIKLQDLKYFNGEFIKNNNKPVNIKDIIVNHLGSHVGKDGKENIYAYQLGMKVMVSQDALQVEDAEFEFIKKTLNRTPPLSSALIIGQVLDIMSKE